jgi:hypothetical protein
MNKKVLLCALAALLFDDKIENLLFSERRLAWELFCMGFGIEQFSVIDGGEGLSQNQSTPSSFSSPLPPSQLSTLVSKTELICSRE